MDRAQKSKFRWLLTLCDVPSASETPFVQRCSRVSVVQRPRATDTTVRRTERTRFRNYESEFLILRRQLGWFTLRSKFYSVGVLSISVKHRSYDNAESWISVAVSFSEASNGENDYESTKIREFDRIGCRTSQFVTKKDTRAKRVQ